VCFFIATIWQIGVIATANYAFLNYIVLALGVLLLDDKFLLSILPARWRAAWQARPVDNAPMTAETAHASIRIRQHWQAIKLAVSAVLLNWIFYATTAELIWMFARVPLPTSPVMALAPFRIANQYGLFAVMTRGRYEIEFQGSDDGVSWTPYPFRYKPQALNKAPGIYAPYQPRFDWNLWFASLGSWREYPLVTNTEERLLTNDKNVLALFAGNPFPNKPPRQVRAVLWQYWFTSMAEKRATGNWWKRQMLGLYAPTLEHAPDGSIQVTEWPTVGQRE
jgi:hypothetical protein